MYLIAIACDMASLPCHLALASPEKVEHLIIKLSIPTCRYLCLRCCSFKSVY